VIRRLATLSDADIARPGWQHVGAIPDDALWPQGRLCAMTVFHRRLA
jgi:hypothetical protein